MRLGRFKIEHLSEGRFESYLDGSFQKMDYRSTQSTKSPPVFVEKTSASIGIDPILIQGEDANILLETGLGWGLDHNSRNHKVSNLKTNLEIFGLTPRDITHVILSHLHYDHAAGSTFNDEELKTRPTMPNASYFVQKREWEFALNSLEQKQQVQGAGYQLDELYRLVADNRFYFIDEDYLKILPGIEVIWSGGHTPGHQIVRISDQHKVAYYMGDLVPSDAHLNHYSMRHIDLNPEQARQMKMVLLRQAYKEDAFLLFYHSLYTKYGKLSKDRHRKYVLQD